MSRVPRDPTPYFSVAAQPYRPALAFHNYVARSLHLPATFRPLPSLDLPAVLAYAKQQGAGGLIVGKHLERRALPLADDVASSANEAGAANALVFDASGKIRAVNSVVDAARSALRRARVRSNDVVVIHGAGAPASAVCAALRAHGVNRVVITGRNEHAGRLLAALHGYTWLDSIPRDASILINATPLGDMGPLAKAQSLPTEAIENASAVIDLALGPHATPVVRLARAAGIRAVSGMSVVADQWAGIFRTFTGAKIRPGHVERGLREAYVPDAARRRLRSIPA